MDGAEYKETWYLVNGAEQMETWYLMDGAKHKMTWYLVNGTEQRTKRGYCWPAMTVMVLAA
jgi:hypothetical protein